MIIFILPFSIPSLRTARQGAAREQKKREVGANPIFPGMKNETKESKSVKGKNMKGESVETENFKRENAKSETIKGKSPSPCPNRSNLANPLDTAQTSSLKAL